MADIEMPTNNTKSKGKADKTKVLTIIIGIVGVALTYLMYRHSKSSSSGGYAGQVATPTGTGGQAAPDQTSAFSGALTSLGGQLSDLQSQVASQGSDTQSALAKLTHGAAYQESQIMNIAHGKDRADQYQESQIMHIAHGNDRADMALTKRVASLEHKLATAVKATSTPKKQHVSHPHAVSTQQHYYTVKAGDNLSEIASHYHESWQQLYQKNHTAVGSNPNLIHPGLRLKVP